MSPGELNPAQYERLHHLLASAFTPESLHGVLLRIEGGRAVCDELPSVAGSPGQFFHRTVEALRQHGLMQGLLFEALLQHRPHRRREIVAVAEAFGVDLEAPGHASTSAPAVICADEARAELPLNPRLGAWCLRQGRSLAALIAGAGLAAGLALLLCPRAAAPGGPDAILLAVEVGHVAFCGLALVCLALWRTPDASGLFGASPGYARMWRRLGALEDAASAHAPTLRAAAGADPRTREALTRWLDAAIEAREQFRRSWLWLWLCWMSLYGVAVAVELGRPRLSAHAFAVLKILLTSLNNGAAAALFVGFWVLTFVTVPIGGGERRDAARPGAAGIGVVAAGLVVAYGLVELAAVLAGMRALPGASEAELKAAIEATAGAFDVGSGLVSAVILAMFVGRFDSKFIDASWPVLAVLYLYAAVQPSWSVLELVERTGTGAEAAQHAVFVFAWLAKLVLFALFAWIFHTGRLDFYFLRVRRLQAGVGADWRALTE